VRSFEGRYRTTIRPIGRRTIGAVSGLGLLRRLAGPLGSGAALMFLAATTAGNAANFLFHVIVSRQLGPSHYGALGAILGLVVVLAVPAGAVQLAITQRVARNRGTQDALPLAIGPVLSEAVIWAVGSMVCVAAVAPLLTSFLHLPNLRPTLILAVYVVPVAVGLVPKAVLLGEQRFVPIAAAVAVGAAVRLLIGPLLVRAGTGLDGAIAASVFGELATTGVALAAARGSLSQRDDARPMRISFRDVSAPAIALTGLWLLTGLDSLLARHYLPAHSSGLYVAAATAGRVSLFLPGAVATIAFPIFAASDSRRARQALIQTTSVVAGIGGAAVVAMLLESHLVVRILFGERYDGSAALLGMLACASALLGIASTLLHFHLARAHTGVACLAWFGIVVTGALTVAAHASPFQIALAMVAGVGVVGVLMLVAGLAEPEPSREPEAGAGALWDIADPTLDLTVVVPYYNPGTPLRDNIGAILESLDATGSTYEVIAISDGSTDGSANTLVDLSDRLSTVALPKNSGKGAAVRLGLARGRGRYLGFIDSDGDIDPSVLQTFLTLASVYEPHVILGSKRHPQSTVLYPPIRRVYSWTYQQLVRLLFRLNVRDTQTGVKLIRRDVLAHVLPRMLEKRFAFDVELLVIARRLGYRGFLEAPVTIRHQFTSTVSFRSVWATLVDTLAIFYRLRMLGYYDREIRPPAGEPAAVPAPIA
jgi:O-antigen/teichoic acid export membrane protein